MRPQTAQISQMEPTLAEATRFVRGLHAFALDHGGACYDGWPHDLVFRYLAWQFCARQICVVHDRASIELAGFLVLWPDDSTQIRYREAEGLPHFDWQLRSGGDSYILAEVIVREGDRGWAVRRLGELAARRWPDWKLRRLFTWRRGRLVELNPAAVARCFHEQSS